MFSNYRETKTTLIYQQAKTLKSSKDGLPLTGTGDAKSQLVLAKVALIDVMSFEKESDNKATQYFLDKSYKWAKYATQVRTKDYKNLNEAEAQQARDIESGIIHRISKSY